jgi:hypothetical protein
VDSDALVALSLAILTAFIYPVVPRLGVPIP